MTTKEIVHNPIFDKPIQTVDYSKQGVRICVTKFSKLINNGK